MPVPASINDLSTTVASNSPSGSETPTDGDNYLRTFASFIALLRDLTNGTTAPTLKTPTITGSSVTWSGDPTHSGNHTFSGTVSASNVTSGTYTPTLTAVANVSATTARVTQYTRVGNVVTVAGNFDIDPTTAPGVFTSIGISLPVASDFASLHQCGGVAYGYNGSSEAQHGGIQADITNNRATLEFIAGAASNNIWTFTFTYLVL